MISAAALRCLATVAAFNAVSGCTKSGATEKEISAEIERQVQAKHPDVSLDRFARFYAHGPNNSVRATYVFANEGYRPIVGRVGEVVWTTADKLPQISDGSCAVINVQYDSSVKLLRSVECNGPGGE